MPVSELASVPVSEPVSELALAPVSEPVFLRKVIINEKIMDCKPRPKIKLIFSAQ